ncbi:DUF3127 domain-containing protein [Sediminitomix flava]|uniref:Uncharacterized protein DUF3127 n=1 Tax=Sediminitomix flava TaxID=379075 RepID=A0A315ZB62_SEDFL|nr:DUF3127 domain-containing protein [Sediminitomix flava]PWJ42399.1 uncharacterized protein DUF3127 [Sediminitomix flava]
MSFELRGKLEVLFDEQVISEKFKKREFVVVTADMYPQYIKMQATQDRCSLLDQFKVGDEIQVSFDLKGRPFTNREGQTMYFTNVEAWRITAPQAAQPQGGQAFPQQGGYNAAPMGGNTPPPPPPPVGNDDDEDALPF